MTNKEAITNLLALKTAQIAQVSIDIDLETFDLAIKALEFIAEECPMTFDEHLKGEKE